MRSYRWTLRLLLLLIVAAGTSLAAAGNGSPVVVPDGGQGAGVVCGASGSPYCTWAFAPGRTSLPREGDSDLNVHYGGTANYNGVTVKVCITIRLLISTPTGSNPHVMNEYSFCNPPNGTGTDTSTNVWHYLYWNDGVTYYWHTWVHSWQVWADGHAHNDRYVESGIFRFA